MGSAAPSLAAEANLSQPEAIDERKRALSTAAATSSPGETEVAETEEEKKKRQRLERFEQQEEIKQKKLLDKTRARERTQEKRRLEREQGRETRRMQAQTPEGRARIWLNGLQSHIRVCNDEIALCNSPDCVLPQGIAKEYGATWSARASSFKRVRTNIEKVLNGQKAVQNFKAMADKAASDVKEFKTDIQRYRTLQKGYQKALDKKTRKGQAEAAAQAADVEAGVED